uniref:CSON007865 protein n=1 Tax=Culicoides sonorensis TaxID=179676 RepID=A0A336MVD0_CULSO
MFYRLLFCCLFIISQINDSYQEKSSLSLFLDGIECVAATQSWDCIKNKFSRSLEHWDETLKAEKEEFIGELDMELTNLTKRHARNLGASQEESPSEIITSALQDVDEISETISSELSGFTKKSDENADAESVDPSNDDDEETQTEEARQSGGSKGGKKGNKKKGGYYYYDDHDEHDDFEWYGKGKGKKGGYRGGGGKGKKKKGYMKIFMVGAALKAKLEMLLKLLSFHLQLKFFAIAAIGLIVNIARFWLDVKKGQAPQKVIYYEHAQHQHHYDEHAGGDDWSGGYWKRTNEPYQYNNGYDMIHDGKA